MKIFTVSDGQDVALGERALGGHASEQAMDSIPQTRSERNPPLRGDQAKLFGGRLPKVDAQHIGRSRQLTNAGRGSVHAIAYRFNRTACGFRNRERFRFRNAIYLHLGGLELHSAFSV